MASFSGISEVEAGECNNFMFLYLGHSERSRNNYDYLLFSFSVSESTYLWFAAHEYSHLALEHFDTAVPTNSKVCDVATYGICTVHPPPCIGW